MHAIEKELIRVTGYKVQRKFSDRQDYLKSIFNAANKLADDDFDTLSDEAAQWLNDCVQAYNTSRKADLPDFDEVSDGVDVEPADDEVEAADDSEGSEDGEGTEEAEEDDGSDGGIEASDADDSDDEPELGPDDEPEPAPRKSKKVKAKKESKPKIPKPVAKSKRIPKDEPPPEFTEDAALDKWGCLVGSKNALALELFEKGATTREVKEKLGGTYYNILGKMEQRGHRLEKEGSGFIKLTHKDDLKVSSRKPKK